MLLTQFRRCSPSLLGDGRVVLVLDGEEPIQLAGRGIDPSMSAAVARIAS